MPPDESRRESIAPLSSVFLSAMVLAFAGGCEAAVQRTAPTAEERFARTYITTLRDSGAAAVLPRTKAETRALENIGAVLDTLDALLSANATDSLKLVSWKIVRESGRPSVTQLVYRGSGERGPFQVGLWVERDAGALVAETIHFGPVAR